jgi:cadmium resistance protein CadD (predicted permease)
VLATGLLTLIAVLGIGSTAVGEPRSRCLLVAAALAVCGVLAAATGAKVPSGLLGFVGLVPLVRGLGALTSVRFRAEPPSRGRLLADAAAAYLPVVATRAAEEVLVATGVLVVGAALGVLLPRTAPRPALAPWTLVVVGAALLVEGGSLSWLLGRR